MNKEIKFSASHFKEIGILEQSMIETGSSNDRDNESVDGPMVRMRMRIATTTTAVVFYGVKDHDIKTNKDICRQYENNVMLVI